MYRPRAPGAPPARRAAAARPPTPWGNTNQVVSKGPLYPSNIKIIIFVAF